MMARARALPFRFGLWQSVRWRLQPGLLILGVGVLGVLVMRVRALGVWLWNWVSGSCFWLELPLAPERERGD